MKPILYPAFAFLLASYSVQAAEININWQAPTQNVDGSPLTDLAGYKLYIGEDSRDYSIVESIQDAEATSATLTVPIPWLTMGDNTVYLAMTALDAEGNESVYSNEVTRVLTFTDDIAPGAPVIITITIEIGVDCPAGITCNVE